jgi:hypothetical protein
MAQNQNWAFSVAGWKTVLNPRADRVPVNTEQTGSFFDRVAAELFDESVVGVALTHRRSNSMASQAQP